ncbi:MAG: radical SAM protein [Candidatus Riflebacteria bacterium]|nr:radical SAM protein [Candidatus Riflebacteria bacterium]
MKILIANPPWLEDAHFGVRSGARFPYMTNELTWEGVPTWIPFPFHPAMAAALLKKNGFHAEFWDGVAEGAQQKDFLDRIKAFQPDLYIQETVAPSYPYDVDFFQKLREILPRCVLGVAGLMVTSWGRQMFEENPVFDVGLTYEWEETTLELANRLQDGSPLDGVQGLIHRQGSEIILEVRRPSPDLKKLPWPLRDRLPMLRYNDDFAFLPVPNLQMYSSRGCPYKCTFCVWIKARYGNYQVRYRDPEDIVSEIEDCLEKWPFRAVYFDDDTFNINKNFTLQICETMQRRGLKIPWAGMCRADLFDRETLEACKKAGMVAVKYGIESADQEILNGIKKNLNIHKAEEVIRITKELGIKVHLTLMVGLPGETEQTLKKTWRFVKRVRPDYMQFSLATPYPGTDLYDEAVEKGWIESKKWNEFNADSHAVMRTAALSREDLERWIRKMNLLRFGLQFVENPWQCIRTYSRKALQSPRKLLNAGKYFLKLCQPKP